ncbi:helix-turn-helix transcriptional regulator [Actinomadura parmotrematis]|uniref:WYL domain-containing protein n=1 Tax=Actinomadura parmotrematis TaxID=2864039 RepID=A0ABS7G3V7_9ACTN|nr:WYL domain-containing protein [Actinomadura parmotrematis]MBW8487402.1 WYL domain-containing protein [Actinomadura parmotrematis]
MADVTERMLALLATLQTGRAFGGAELARRLDVSPRTLRRDIDRLRGYGYPVETRPGPGGHYRLAGGRTLPPLVLDDDEAVATLVALAALTSSGPADGGGIGDAAARAYGKLDQFLPARLRPRAASIRASLETAPRPDPGVAAGHLGLLAEAIAHRETVTFGYTGAGGAATERHVEPYRQVHHLLRWYLLAWDTGRGDWRVFRIDRIAGPARTGRRYEPRPLPDGSALAHLRRGLRRERRPVRLSVAAPAARVADALRHEDAEIAPAGPGRTDVVLALDSWRWLVLHLAFLDADFTLDAPADLAAPLRAFGRRLLAAAPPRKDGPANDPPGGARDPSRNRR